MSHLREQWRTAVGANERTYKQYVMRHTTEDFGERRERHVIRTYDGNQVVGELMWYGTTGTIDHVYVPQPFSRQGIATAMWEWGQEFKPKPKHSGDRTTQGDAWARSVGGPLPRNKALASVIAMPSWRPFNTPSTEHFKDQYDAVIASDRGRPSGYDVYTYGVLVARRGTLEEAQQYVQDVYGPLQWQRVIMPKAMVHHYYFSLTDEFTDPVTIWTVERLPRLG